MNNFNLGIKYYDWTHNFTRASYCVGHGEDIFHSISLFGCLSINDEEHDILYQNGNSFCCGSYDAPTNTLELEGGDLCILLSDISDDDFIDIELITECLEKAKTLCKHIDTIEKLRTLYDFFHAPANQPQQCDYYLDDWHTYNIDDYIIDEASGYLKLKN